MAFFNCNRIRLWWIVVTLPLLLVLLSADVQADTEQFRVKLGPWVDQLEVGPKMNAAGKCLRDSEFVGQDLSQAVFDGCDLQDVRIHDCNLSNASFKGARLTGALIGDCKIDGADFTDAVINGVKSSIGGHAHDLCLSEPQLMSTRSYRTKDLSNCVIYGDGCRNNRSNGSTSPPIYNFTHANLRNATFIGGNYSVCDFTDADITGAKFYSCIVPFERLALTKSYRMGALREMRLSGVALEGKVSFSGKNLTGSTFLCRLPEADFNGADITACTFARAMTTEQLRTTKNYREGNLSGITFMRIDLSGCDLSRQNLTGSKFAQCDFTGVNLEDAVITDTHFARVPFGDSTGLRADQIKGTWNYKNRRIEGVVLPKDIADVLSDKEPSP